MTVHLFGGLGMMPFNIVTDPGLPNFMQRAKVDIPSIVLHGPFRDYATSEVAAEANVLPASDLVFYVGTSLAANDGPIIAGYAKRKIHLWLFQASLYGPHSTMPDQCPYAHLITSNNPIPLPFLGDYKPAPGHLTIGKNYIISQINDPHPGDAVLSSQLLFIEDMKRVITKGGY